MMIMKHYLHTVALFRQQNIQHRYDDLVVVIKGNNIMQILPLFDPRVKFRFNDNGHVIYYMEYNDNVIVDRCVRSRGE